MLKIVRSALLLLFAASLPALAATHDGGVAVAHDLHKDAALARSKRVPVLIVFTRPDCTYCDRVIYYYLVPMQRNPASAGKVMIRRLDMTSTAALTDFDGKVTTNKQFAAAHKVHFAPTVIVFTPDGKRAAKPLVGLGPEDYYGGFLDQAVDAGWSKLHPASH